MTRLTSISVACPECKNEQKVTVWDSINITLDPTLREKLFQGEINRFKCLACGREAILDIPLLYHDMNRHFCVQYYPPQSLEDPEFIQMFESKYPPTFKRGPNNKELRYIAEPHRTEKSYIESTKIVDNKEAGTGCLYLVFL